ALAACEQMTVVEGTITIEASIAPSNAASLRVIVDGHPDPSIAWDPAGKYSQEADPGGDGYTPGTLEYPYNWEDLAPLEHALFVAACIDLDGDSLLDAGDPFGLYGDNAIIDAKEGPHGGNVASLTIDMVQ